MKALWIALKIFISIALVLLGLVSIFTILWSKASYELLPFATSLLFLAGALWVKYPSIRSWFGIGALGVGMFYMSYCMLVDTSMMPKQCTGRASLFCHLQNGLFDVAGKPGAAFPWLLGGIFSIHMAYRLKKTGTPEPKRW